MDKITKEAIAATWDKIRIPRSAHMPKPHDYEAVTLEEIRSKSNDRVVAVARRRLIDAMIDEGKARSEIAEHLNMSQRQIYGFETRLKRARA